jgi:SAM-dependent methyltransferase
LTTGRRSFCNLGNQAIIRFIISTIKEGLLILLVIKEHETAMSYDAFATTFSNSRKNHPWPELDYIIEDMKNRDSLSVLDIGCGNGRFLEEAKNKGLKIERYLGIDNST